MPAKSNRRPRSLAEVRAALAEQLRARRVELEAALCERVRNTEAEPVGDEDAEFTMGQTAAIAAVLEYALTGIEHGEGWSGSTPLAAVLQVRRSVSKGLNLNTVLNRYIVGHGLLWDLVMEEVDSGDFADQRTALLRQISIAQVSLLGGLVDSITHEYMQEVGRVARSQDQRRSEHVRDLLDGSTADVGALGYDLDSVHVGVIATGANAKAAVRDLSGGLDRQLLSVSCGDGMVWAWLGGRREFTPADLERVVAGKAFADASIAIGEPADGITGFRLTHRQAQAALWVAQRKPQRLTRYADVALVAFALRDAALARSLVDIYLSPLGSQRDGGAVLRQTLRAYFLARHNASATAAALGVARHTVENRLRTIEQMLGHLLHTHRAELEVALRLEELGDVAGGNDSSPVSMS